MSQQPLSVNWRGRARETLSALADLVQFLLCVGGETEAQRRLAEASNSGHGSPSIRTVFSYLRVLCFVYQTMLLHLHHSEKRSAKDALMNCSSPASERQLVFFSTSRVPAPP